LLYAPGIRTREQIAAVVAAVAPKPVNLLIGGASEFSVADVAALGVRRISVGGALARAAWSGFLRAARGIADGGRFDGFADAASGQQLNALFETSAEAPAACGAPRREMKSLSVERARGRATPVWRRTARSTVT
jgi:2-methylisocitrate lyase-like PEP mutase family enzyme